VKEESYAETTEVSCWYGAETCGINMELNRGMCSQTQLSTLIFCLSVSILFL